MKTTGTRPESFAALTCFSSYSVTVDISAAFYFPSDSRVHCEQQENYCQCTRDKHLSHEVVHSHSSRRAWPSSVREMAVPNSAESHGVRKSPHLHHFRVRRRTPNA